MNEAKYKVVNDTSFHINTPNAVVAVLERAREVKTRIRIFYGDTQTGRDWMEIFDTVGIIGRSCGPIKIPLLFRNSRSYGGHAILAHHIVKITIDKNVVYQHPKYNLPKLYIREASDKMKRVGFLFAVYADDKLVSNCRTLKQAEHEIQFFNGSRNILA